MNEGIPEIPIVREAYRGKPKSNILLYLMDKGNFSRVDICKLLGLKNSTYIDNMLHRDSLDLDKVMALLNAAGMSMCLLDENDNPVVKIDPYDFLYKSNMDYIINYKDFKDKNRKEKYEEYLKLKEKLKQYEEELGVQ